MFAISVACCASASAWSRSSWSTSLRVATSFILIAFWASRSIRFRSMFWALVISVILRSPWASNTLLALRFSGGVWSSWLIVTVSSVRPFCRRSFARFSWTAEANSSRLICSSSSSFVAATDRSALTSFS